MDSRGEDLADVGIRLAIKQGFPGAWELLHSECDAWLRRKAGWLLDAASDAEDAVAETWRRAFSRASHYDPTWSPRTWLARILAHVCADMTRYAERRRRTPVEGEPPASEHRPVKEAAE